MKTLIVTLKMPTNFFTSQANALKTDHTATKKRRPGIINLYADFAEDRVELYERKGNVKKISRERVERQLLSSIDEAEFPIEYKMSWYYAVLVSTTFDAFWRGVSKRHKLPTSCTKRFEPDISLYEYDAPTDLDEDEEDAEHEVDHEAEEDAEHEGDHEAEEDAEHEVDHEAEEGAEHEEDREAEDDDQDEIYSTIHNNATLAQNTPPSSVSQTPARPTDHDSPSSSSSSGASSRSGTPDGWVPLTKENMLARLSPPPRPVRCAECGCPWQPCFCVDGDNDSGCASERGSQYGENEAQILANPSGGLRDQYETPTAASGTVNGLAGEEGDDSAYDEPLSSNSKGKGKAKASSNEYSRAASGDTYGPPQDEGDDSQDEGDDSEYEDTRSKSKGKAKAKVTPTLKDAAKPKGVTKNKAAPKKKEQTTAQLKTAAAKTREPSTKTSQAITTPAHTPNGNNTQAQVPTAPSQAAVTPARPSNGNNLHNQATAVPDELGQKTAQAQAATAPTRTQGLKRWVELHPDDDEEDSPASKRAKVGGAAAPNGGRKKATPKKNTKMVPIDQAWDGKPMGFDDYYIL